jgi:very-short-patch-repair endonuclease
MKGQTKQKILKPKLQRRLRTNMTDAEQCLWRCLKRKQMGEFKFRRQHPFGSYVIDFVCLEAMVAVEVDGGQHSENTREEALRTKSLTDAGFEVLRFWNNDVLRDIDAVKESIWLALQQRRSALPHPHPSLPLKRPIPIPTFPLKGKERTAQERQSDREGEKSEAD